MTITTSDQFVVTAAVKSALKHADVPWKQPRVDLSDESARRVMAIKRSAHSDASSLEPHSSPQYSASCPM